jgi:hypothetical protein
VLVILSANDLINGCHVLRSAENIFEAFHGLLT